MYGIEAQKDIIMLVALSFQFRDSVPSTHLELIYQNSYGIKLIVLILPFHFPIDDDSQPESVILRFVNRFRYFFEVGGWYPYQLEQRFRGSIKVRIITRYFCEN